MMGRWTKTLVALLALTAGGVSVSASDSPVTDRWQADPEEQYLLDVRLRANRLGDGVRAYPTPEGACIVFGDFLTTLDVPLKIDLEAQRASGWAFNEDNPVDIDRAAGTATINGNRKSIATSDIREVPEGWCIDSAALSQWFGLDVDANMAGAVLRLESEAKLPVELAVERRKRAERLAARADFNIEELPQVKLPYRMWRTPALDVVVSAGAAYSDGGVEVDRSAAIYASGEFAKMSFDARVATRNRGIGESVRVRAYRSDPGGGLLGPLGATHLEVGDLVHGSNGIGTSVGSGRGLLVTNRPLRRLANFDRVSFEGELPAGWDAELYRNGQLLAFAATTPDGRYRFEDIELQYGENEVEIVLYGPQGQIRRRHENVLVGDQQIPPGKTWYFASASQPDREVLSFGHDTEPYIDAQATIAVDHGIDQKTSAGLLAQTLLLEDETVSWVEGTVRRTVGNALVEASVRYNSRGGYGLRGRAVGEVGPVSLGLSSEIHRGPSVDDRQQQLRGDHSLSASIPITIGDRRVPLTARARVQDFADGSRAISAGGRFSLGVGRLNLGTEIDWTRSGINRPGVKPRDQIEARLVGAGRVGPVRLQGTTDFDLDDLRLERAGVSAFWSGGENVAWDAGLAFEPRIDRVRARVSHVRRFDWASVALTAEAASDGSVAAGINLAFSLDTPNGSFRPTSKTLARNGSLKARIFRDDNANGIRDADEPYQPGVAIVAGRQVSDTVTNDEGELILAGLPTHVPIAIGIDHDSLGDPSLTPMNALKVMVPRPGVTGEIDIPLVGAGLVEGTLVNPTGPVEGVELILLDRTGSIVARTRSDFDGYFLFEGVAYGNYRLALAKTTAELLMVKASLDIPAMVGPDQPYMRVGTIALAPDSAKIAARGASGAGIAEAALLDTLPFATDGPAPAPTIAASAALDTAAIVDALVGGEL